MVSNREDLQSDCKTVNAIVSGLPIIQSGTGSSDESCQSVGQHDGHQQMGRRRRSSASKINYPASSSSPTMSPPHVLPRPQSENNFAAAAASAAVTAVAFGAPKGHPIDCGDRISSAMRKSEYTSQSGS